MNVNINGLLFNMEGDTGSAVSVISYGTYLKYFNDTTLLHCRSNLKNVQRAEGETERRDIMYR